MEVTFQLHSVCYSKWSMKKRHITNGKGIKQKKQGNNCNPWKLTERKKYIYLFLPIATFCQHSWSFRSLLQGYMNLPRGCRPLFRGCREFLKHKIMTATIGEKVPLFMYFILWRSQLWLWLRSQRKTKMKTAGEFILAARWTTITVLTHFAPELEITDLTTPM